MSIFHYYTPQNCVFFYKRPTYLLLNRQKVVMMVILQPVHCSPAAPAVLFPMVRIPAAWLLEPWSSWCSRLCRRCSSSSRLPRVRMPAAASSTTVPPLLVLPERHSKAWRRQERGGCLQHSDTLWASQPSWDSSSISTNTKAFCSRDETSFTRYKVIKLLLLSVLYNTQLQIHIHRRALMMVVSSINYWNMQKTSMQYE